MKNNKTPLIIVLAVLAVAILLIGTASVKYAAMSPGFHFKWGFGNMDVTEAREEIKLDLSGVEDIDIEYRSADVIFYKGSGDTLVIKEYLREDGNEPTEVIKSNERILVKQGRKLPFFGFFFGMWGREYVEVYLPESYHGNMDVSTSSGSIRSDEDWEWKECRIGTSSGSIKMAGITAQDMRVSSSSGSISLLRADADKVISTSSGGIRVDSGKGDIDLSSSSGSIRVKDIQGAVDATSSSGSIIAEISSMDGDISLSSSSGRIEAVLPSSSAFHVEVKTSSGGIRTDFDEVMSYNKKGNHAEGSYGTAPEYHIRVTTSSGGVSLGF